MDKPRYFAIVIEDTRPCLKPDSGQPFSLSDGLRSGIALVAAATELGDTLRESNILPEGCRVTRSIAITQELATRAW